LQGFSLTSFGKMIQAKEKKKCGAAPSLLRQSFVNPTTDIDKING